MEILIMSLLGVAVISLLITRSSQKHEIEDLEHRVEAFKRIVDEAQNKAKDIQRELDLQKIDRFRSFQDLDVGEVFICIPFYGNIQYRTVVQMPNDKYQIVQVDEGGKITGPSVKSVANCMDEMIKVISETPSYFRKVK